MKMRRGPDVLVRTRGTLLVMAGSFILLGAPGHPRAAGEAPGTAVQKAADLKIAVIPVEGMACVSCAATVKRTVKAIDGVSDVEVMLAKGSVRVTYAPGRVSPDHIAATINKLGYKAGTPADTQ